MAGEVQRKHAWDQLNWCLDRIDCAAADVLADWCGAHVARSNSIQSPSIASHSSLDDDLIGRVHRRAYRAQQAVPNGGDSMKKRIVTLLVLLAAVAAYAASAPANSSGTWNFAPAQSRNVGMMAKGTIQTVITQSKLQLVVEDNSDFSGQKDTQHTVYDLTGTSVTNASMMAGQATTRSHWDGAQLITDWESPGAIAGTMTKRTEKRYLSNDGDTMFVESTRAGKDTIVMVFLKGK